MADAPQERMSLRCALRNVCSRSPAITDRPSAAVPVRGKERPGPPAGNQPEYYYGFIGVAVAWQIAFFVLAKDPVRYRPLMIPAIIEKASFGIAVMVLFVLNRVSLPRLGAGLVDLILGTFFVVAYLRTPARGG